MRTILAIILGLITFVSHAQFGAKIEVGVIADSDNPLVRAILRAIENETETLLGNKTEFDIDLREINNGLYILTITHGSLGTDQHRFEVDK